MPAIPSWLEPVWDQFAALLPGGPVHVPSHPLGCRKPRIADARIIAGLERRGITDPDKVHVEPWSIGTFAASEEAGRRLAWTLLFYRERPDDNSYAKPIHGLHAVVDYDDMSR